jgi:hypothetical protein
MAANLTRLTHTIAIQLHLVAGNCTIYNSRSRWPVRKLLDTSSYVLWPIHLINVGNMNYEAPCHVIFSSPLLLCLSHVQISSSGLCAEEIPLFESRKELVVTGMLLLDSTPALTCMVERPLWYFVFWFRLFHVLTVANSQGSWCDFTPLINQSKPHDGKSSCIVRTWQYMMMHDYIYAPFVFSSSKSTKMLNY